MIKPLKKKGMQLETIVFIAIALAIFAFLIYKLTVMSSGAKVFS